MLFSLKDLYYVGPPVPILKHSHYAIVHKCCLKRLRDDINIMFAFKSFTHSTKKTRN